MPKYMVKFKSNHSYVHSIRSETLIPLRTKRERERPENEEREEKKKKQQIYPTQRNPSHFVSRIFLNTNNVSLLHFRLMPESRIEHSPISWCSREQFVNIFFFSLRLAHSLGCPPTHSHSTHSHAHRCGHSAAAGTHTHTLCHSQYIQRRLYVFSCMIRCRWCHRRRRTPSVNDFIL